MNWADFFHMGGYAYYVWPAWGITCAVLFLLWLQPKLKRRRLLKQIARSYAREKLNS